MMTIRTAKKSAHRNAATVKQRELPGMPPKPKSSLRAEELLAALDEVEAKKTNAEHRRLALVGQMKADNLTKVTVVHPASAEKRTFILETLEKLKQKKAAQ